MACEHLDDFAKEAISIGIFKEAVKKRNGVWEGTLDTSRVFNMDETPQFISNGQDGTQPRLVYAEKGQECKGFKYENRECVTIVPIVSFSGTIVECHVIFPAKQITSHMAPVEAVENIQNLLISTTDSGYQEGCTLLDSLKLFDKYLGENNIQRPVIMMCDGHSSRFDLEVLRFCQEKQIRLFLTPPDTTSVTQLLDQINNALHSSYRKEKSSCFQPDETINKEGFMIILSSIWATWADKESIIKAAKRVGITAEGVSVDFMQKDRFAMTAALDEECKTPVKHGRTPWEVESPVHVRSGSKAYYKAKVDLLEARLKEVTETENILSLEDIERLAPPKKFRRAASNHTSPWFTGRQTDY